jgi:putative Mg2+ transporter-C (MgtC) family protein
MFDWHESFVWLSKLLLAAVLGGAIGFERESHGQSAGFRTNLLVSLGACLMMMLSLHMADIFRGVDAKSVVRLDPGRIASYAVASMGFLGAGAIIKGRGSVRGLTTAAGLWLVTGIGLAAGAGYVGPAVYTTIISLLILYNLRFMKFFFSHDEYTLLTLTCVTPERPLTAIKKILADYDTVDLRFVNFRRDIVNGTVTYRLRLRSKEHVPWGEIVARLTTHIPGLIEIAWEESDVP